MSALRIVVGPGVGIERDALERWAGVWGRELDRVIEVRWAERLEELGAALGGGAAGVVIAPGALADASRLPADVPVAWVDIREAETPRPAYLGRDATSVRGRGVAGFQWALRHLLQRQAWPYEVVPYGAGGRDGAGDLRLPAGAPRPWPVAVLLHGGFWRERWERDTIEPLAVAFARRGYASWNLEYRRTGPHGGGWPATARDVAAGIDQLVRLAEEHPLDLARVVVVGHSAGGQLALWSVRRRGGDGPPRVTPRLVVSLAGVTDLVAAARRGLGDTGNATAAFMGGSPDAIPDAYAAASPVAALPLGVRQLVVQGLADRNADLVDLNRSYVSAARAAGDDVCFLELEDAGHFDVIDPETRAWACIADRIDDLLT